MFIIKKIQLNELLDFIKSDEFSRLENKPISSLRVSSYLNNPYAKQDDVVLYMAFDVGTLVGYRTIWRDNFYFLESSKSFGWLSGNWVHAKYRRKGISTQLFNEVYKDWNGKLMYTNYAVNSKLLYDKTGHFSNIKPLIGIRFYTRFCLGEILEKKHKIFKSLKLLIVFFDGVFNFLFDFRFLFLKKRKLKSEVIKNEIWNTKIDIFLKDFKEKEFFKREEKVYKWIQDFPWVGENNDIKNEALTYYFSLYAKDFQNNYFTFYDEKSELIAFLWLSLRDGHLKIPYVYFKNENLEEIVSFILNKVKEEKVKTFLVYDKEIEKKLKQEMYFITKKTFYQNFFATKKLGLNPENIQNKEIQSGNGDVIFT